MLLKKELGFGFDLLIGSGEEAYVRLEQGGIRFEKIRIVTNHGGRGRNNGGEYREGYDLIPRRNGGEYFEKRYWSSADFKMCPVRGHYSGCSTCYQEFCKNDEYDRVLVAEIADLMRKFDYVVDIVDYMSDDFLNYKRIEVDVTGHDYVSCNHGGGCIICYPCNHVSCSEKIKEKEVK